MAQKDAMVLIIVFKMTGKELMIRCETLLGRAKGKKGWNCIQRFLRFSNPSQHKMAPVRTKTIPVTAFPSDQKGRFFDSSLVWGIVSLIVSCVSQCQHKKNKVIKMASLC
jgi:hypothetical protein